MQAAQILAGYTLGQADLLRRAMGKKIRKEMQEQRAHFVKGATERGIDRSHADAIFDLLERFAEYGFNKSHAAAYALVAYQTAYMKANYPVEFLAASMTLDMGNTDKLSEFRAEAEPARHQGRAAVGQPLGRRVRCRRQDHPLCAGRAEGRRPAGGRGHRHRARREAVRRPHRLRQPHQSARRQQARAGKPCRRRRLRRARAEPGAGACRASTPCSSTAQRDARGRGRRPERHVRRRGASRDHRDPGGRGLAAGRQAAARIRRHRLLPLGPSARRIRAAAEEHERAVVGASSRAR